MSGYGKGLCYTTALVATLAAMCSPAAAQTWSGGGTDGDWTDPANWAGGVAPVSGGATDLTFGTDGNGFDPTNPTAGFTLHVITLNDGFTQTITGQSLIARGADPNFVTNSNSDLTIANDIAIIDDGGGFQGLFVTGTGTGSLTLSGDLSELEPNSRFRTNVNTTAILSGTNSYTGFTDLLAGSTLIAASDFALGASTGVTRVNNGTTLGLQGNINLQEQLIQITGSGVGGNGGLRNLSGNNTVLGAIAIAGARIQSDAGILTLSGGISGTNANVTFGGAGSIVVSSVIATGAGSVTVDGGTTTFSAANTYTGGTFLNGGVLSVSADNNLGGAAGALTFDGGTLLNTAAFLSGRGVTVNAGGGTFQTDADLTLTRPHRRHRHPRQGRDRRAHPQWGQLGLRGRHFR